MDCPARFRRSLIVGGLLCLTVWALPCSGEELLHGRPAYDSGWVAFEADDETFLIHQVGGSFNDYVVDLYGMNTQVGEWGYLTAEHSTSLGHLGMSLVWNVELGPLVPYLSGGLGWMMFIDAAAFSPHGAVGLKYFPFPGKNLGLRLDARIFQAHLEDNVDASLGPWGGTYADARYEDDFTFKDVVLGLMLRF